MQRDQQEDSNNNKNGKRTIIDDNTGHLASYNTKDNQDSNR